MTEGSRSPVVLLPLTAEASGRVKTADIYKYMLESEKSQNETFQKSSQELDCQMANNLKINKRRLNAKMRMMIDINIVD